MSSVLEQTRKILSVVRRALPDDAAAEIAAIFMPWDPTATYSVGDRVRHDDQLYRCLLAHTAQAGWAPGTAPSLWVRIDDPAVEWPEWVKPLGAHDAYELGAKVTHNGKRWICTAVGGGGKNDWEPGVYGWEVQL